MSGDRGLLEIDVIKARRQLRQVRDAGRDLSFTAFLMYAVARAVAEDRILHAYSCVTVGGTATKDRYLNGQLKHTGAARSHHLR
jgi:hypothetical protein